jgi:hypothetical protein
VPVQAEDVLVTGQADAVIIARDLLRDPYSDLRAARELRGPISFPVQYLTDRDAVRFLRGREADGMKLENCPAYVREWMEREKD